MKFIPILLFFCFSFRSKAQSDLPFYYEQNLPLYGQPHKVSEYYYEYHTQAKAHYYDHRMLYDSFGRIKTHQKSNVGLLDSIPLTFQGIIDPRAITITYSFNYDNQNRLFYFTRHQYQEEVGSFQQDEEWKYDTQGMLTQHNFWEINGTNTLIKNPSFQRTIYRDTDQKVLKIEKSTYSFSARGLVLSEITEFSYTSGKIDTITIYQINNTSKTLKEKRYNMIFKKYDELNTDSLMYLSYTLTNNLGETTQHYFEYDASNRMLKSVATSSSNDTLSTAEWMYEDFKITETRNDNAQLEVYYDQTGYEKYREEFEGGYSLAVPADMNTRIVENGQLKSALLEIWDPVTLFYRKDTEYLYYYENVTSISSEKFAKQLKLYPNPSNGIVHLDNIQDIKSMKLYASDGKFIPLSVGNILTLDVPKGMYILYISFLDNTSQRTKIVIE